MENSHPLSVESRLNNELQSMIGRYGIESVHKVLMNRMKEDYSYLKKYFEDKKKNEDVKKEEPVKKNEKKNETKNYVEVVKNNQVVKNEEVVVVDTVDTVETVESAETAETNEKIVEVKQDKKSSNFRNPKEVKEWQKSQEEKKFEENKTKGVLKKDLLTKENLKKWIEEDGRTFSYIAREYIGCRDTEVSAAAKLWGISKKNK